VTGGEDVERREVDVGEFCRRVESYLTQVNGGHLVRIVGPGFEVVKRWAESGVPLNIVMRGIDRKAERHRHGAATRPLRIEFCEADVREVFDDWRRAIGVAPAGATADSPPPRRSSLPKHVERVLERLGRLTGRLDWPDELRDAIESCRERVQALQEPAGGARGEARAAVVAALEEIDRVLVNATLRHAPEALRQAARREAEADLAPYRERLSESLWRQSVEITEGRLLRHRLGLPTIALHA
jgi:rRNA-processing protein FCF1